MGAPRVPRKKQQTRKLYPNQGSNFKRLWAENREYMLEVVARGKRGRPPGLADGYTLKQINELRPKAEADADRIVKAMEEQGLLVEVPVEVEQTADGLADNEAAAAKAALREAIVMVLMPMNAQGKLAAIRTVLEWTKPKPASTVNNNVNAAEDFLRALAAKE